MNTLNVWIFLMTLTIICRGCQGRESFWIRTIDQDSSYPYTIFPNTMFKGGYVTVQVICSSKLPNAKIRVHWILEELECLEEMFRTARAETLTEDILTQVTYDKLMKEDHLNIAPDRVIREDSNSNVTEEPDLQVMEYEKHKRVDVNVIKFMLSEPQAYVCFGNNIISLKDESNAPYFVGYQRSELPKVDPSYFTWEKKSNKAKKPGKHAENTVATVWENGIYHFMLKIEPANETFPFNATVMVKMRSSTGYLPAIEWPMLPVRGVLALLYLSLGTAWIIIWAKSHLHTLKIHMVIGGISVIGALANTLSFVELSDQNSTGNGIEPLKWLSIFLAVLQNGLMQLLVMIVSTGYGITRPQLHKTLFASAVCLAAVTSVAQFMSIIVLDEEIRIKYNYPALALGLSTVYAILALVTAGWLMIFALMTFIHLCRRKHSSKKIISFTIFTVTCVLTFFVSLVLGLVSLSMAKECSKNWTVEWLFKSYGSMTSFVLLMVLMWLWRPVDQAQTYAFTPLSTEENANHFGDFEEEDEDETLYEKAELHLMST